ncbi:MAG TPA: FAD-binding protein [Saprospiraceae bacterium]|nr:FAD-binding protein [Saprospiraceae bacterium]
MYQEIEISVLPEEVQNTDVIHRKALKKSGWKKIDHLHIRKRSIDARQRKVVFRLRVQIYLDELPPKDVLVLPSLSSVKDKDSVIIIGAGPAGYFAALELIEQGLKPIVFERGHSVQNRRKSLRDIQQFGVVNPNSNYCFGEGGAGTYSDGKLYTRSHKRGKIAKVLQLLVEHGAHPDILVDAHPHIGSNKLPRIIRAIRETIQKHGGEVHFESKMTDLLIQNNEIQGVIINGSQEFLCKQVILATGHSARDIYRLLAQKKVKIEAKPFALGVRLEHPQPIIDEIQYKQKTRSEHLPAASYSITCQVEKRGVFSFCMCPGGLIVPAATAPGEIVVNGMSLSRRDSPFANSGFVTEIRLTDLDQDIIENPLAGMDFQQKIEQKVFAAGDDSQKAPAQRLTDFVEGKLSPTLPASSYIPGLLSRRVDEILPGFITNHLREALRIFKKKMPTYYTEEANVVAVESRTSSPVRIPRDRATYQHVDIKGLYPCAEGAGYAGGIVSAALDGQNVAKSIAQKVK